MFPLKALRTGATGCERCRIHPMNLTAMEGGGSAVLRPSVCSGVGLSAGVPVCLPQVLLAYPNAVGCASVSAVKQETEAVLQVRLPIGCTVHGTPGTLTVTCSLPQHKLQRTCSGSLHCYVIFHSPRACLRT